MHTSVAACSLETKSRAPISMGFDAEGDGNAVTAERMVSKVVVVKCILTDRELDMDLA